MSEGVQQNPDRSVFAISVNRNQEKNPILRHITRVPWSYNPGIYTDFMIGKGVGVYFLRQYIHDRLKGHRDIYKLCVLLVLCDIPQPEDCLVEITKIAVLTNLTLIVAWNSQEAANYLEAYKSCINKPADSLIVKTSDEIHTQIMEFLTNIKGISQTNARVLICNFKVNLTIKDFKKLNGCQHRRAIIMPRHRIE
ncbi:DNA excision repair protein ERCC-1 [Thelohanellus kitauei]|uniref:DNA excision repair protein ERCC-1 n=1 Tax=Thelohanellus kitauei TaxID=669202 RepID=A0A0C2IWD6_THEKT|nr:DNA excision repair protein ERCC-1 [Thelohanellus kitauei]